MQEVEGDGCFCAHVYTQTNTRIHEYKFSNPPCSCRSVCLYILGTHTRTPDGVTDGSQSEVRDGRQVCDGCLGGTQETGFHGNGRSNLGNLDEVFDNRCHQVSDAGIGGTYMTLLNTIANLGSKWYVSMLV
jgi:hypothetical protein